MSHRPSPTCLSLAALALLAGCSPDAGMLARVGSHPIPSEDFLIVARQIGAGYPGPPDSAKSRLLDDLVRRELLVQGAIGRGYHRDTVVLDQRRRLEEQLLRERLFAEIGGGSLAVSEAEITTFHGWRTRETRARVIFSFSREGIEAALSELRRGTDFGAVADRFNPPGFTPPGGDIGFAAPGLLLPPLDDLIRTTPPGQVVGPVEAAGQGFFLVRIEERRPRVNPPLETERGLITQVLRQRKQRRIMVRALERLTAEYEVEAIKGAAQELTMRVLNSPMGAPTLTTGEQAVPLVRYRGGIYTLGDAFQELLGGRSAPDFHVLPSVERWLTSRALDRVLLAEARAHHYLDEPPAARSVRERTNDFILEGFFNQEVVAAVHATEQDVRALYARTQQAPVLKSAQVLVAIFRDSAAAAQLALTARQAEGLREAVATAAPGTPVRSETLEFPNPNPLWRPLEPYLSELQPGGYAGPIAGLTGWLVVQLVSKNEIPVTFEQLPPDRMQMLMSEATELKRKEHLDAMVANLRREIPVTIYWKRLKKLEWPEMVPAMPLPGEG